MLALLWMLHACAATLRVYDGALTQRTLQLAATAAASRGHDFTSVLDRTRHPMGRTVLEALVCSLLRELGDDAPYAEVWVRIFF